jgi:hypothetical protein
MGWTCRFDREVNACGVLAGKSLGKRPQRRPRAWEDNIKMLIWELFFLKVYGVVGTGS